MSIIKSLKSTGAKLIPSPISIDFEKGGSSKVEKVAPYPNEVFWDAAVPILKTARGIEYVQTPEARFENLPDFDFQPQYIEIDGLRMHYLDEGPKDGEIILMLHGQPVWSFLYRKMINALVPLGYRCVVPDMIGMGKSDKPIHERYHTYDKHCDNTLAFVKAMGLNDITIFIQDWGSLIGTRLVGENPDLFARVILANGDLPLFDQDSNKFYVPNPVVVNPKIKGPKAAMAKHMMKGMYDGFQSWILYCIGNSRPFIGDVMKMMLEGDVSNDIIRGYEAPFPSFIYMAGPRTLPSMNAGLRGQQLGAWKSLQNFEKPFLSLIGLNDNLLGRPSIQEKWISKVPGAKGQDHEQFDNANHFIQEDIGETMADRTHKFIQKNPTSAPLSRHTD